MYLITYRREKIYDFACTCRWRPHAYLSVVRPPDVYIAHRKNILGNIHLLGWYICMYTCTYLRRRYGLESLFRVKKVSHTQQNHRFSIMISSLMAGPHIFAILIFLVAFFPLDFFFGFGLCIHDRPPA